MKKSIKIALLSLLLVVLACGLKFWASNSPVLSDDSSSILDPEIELAFDFSIALQYNSPEAYDMIASRLKPRLDEWMNSHESKKCIGDYDYSFISDGSTVGKKIILGCYIETSYLSYEVDGIVIKDMKVIDWGEVREED